MKFSLYYMFIRRIEPAGKCTKIRISRPKSKKWERDSAPPRSLPQWGGDIHPHIPPHTLGASVASIISPRPTEVLIRLCCQSLVSE